MTSWITGRGDQEVVDAMVKANGDRARLASLVERRLAWRQDGPFDLRHPEVSRPFVKDIEARVPRRNLAIRPKSKRRRR